jgi:hypothetical protein
LRTFETVVTETPTSPAIIAIVAEPGAAAGPMPVFEVSCVSLIFGNYSNS